MSRNLFHLKFRNALHQCHTHMVIPVFYFAASIEIQQIQALAANVSFMW